jgi:pimeloyl-ACP methyl ester carboxylesterase
MSQEAVILVHGIWLPGFEMTLLQARLRRAGYRAIQFHYASLRRTPLENALRLADFADRQDDAVVHFVGHSLGGLIIRHLFHMRPQLRPGRIVTMGTPHKPSQTAHMVYRAALPLLGRSIEQGLLGGAPPWPGTHALGITAGNLGLGFGRLFPRLPKPNDGTVAVAETELSGAADHIVLPVTHTTMLFSAEVAKQTAIFLAEGHFRI